MRADCVPHMWEGALPESIRAGSKGEDGRMSRFSVFIVALVLLGAMAVQCGAQSVERISDNARIDWTNLVYVATGSGAMPSAKEQPNRARAKLMAKDYAKMDALANLLMAIEGTAISYESTGKDYMANTTIRQKVEGFVKNAQITKTWEEVEEGDKIIMVEVRAPMWGKNAPGPVFVQEAPKIAPPDTVVETSVKVVLKPDKAVSSTTVTVKPSAPSEPYTGLIVDCSGYKLDRCMSPKIRREDGSEVWGTVKADYDMVLEKGIVAYTTSLAEARKHPRAGSNPLIIPAVGRGGGRFYSDPIISPSNADLLMAENGKSGFLNKFNVVFVKDPKVH